MTGESNPTHRTVVAIWHILVLAMLTWAFFGWRDGGDVHWIWLALFAAPLLTLAVTFARISSSRRSFAYWVLAGVCIPSAAAGLSSIVGWMFLVSIVILIWAARRENPASEMVQM